jgi:nucleoid DNA-binding protein
LSLGKKDIINNLSSEAFLHKTISRSILNSFINLIKSNTSKKIKISNFGTFYFHKAPQRVGRNPKTKEEFMIPTRRKLAFKASLSLKKKLN